MLPGGRRVLCVLRLLDDIVVFSNNVDDDVDIAEVARDVCRGCVALK